MRAQLLRGQRLALWLLLPLLALVFDWLSKVWVVAKLSPGESVPVIKGFFNLTLGYNPGAVFGSLQGAPAWLRTAIFTVVGIFALVFFGYEFLKEGTPRFQRVALGLILGGALGNGLDRLLRGAVVDFLDLYFRDWHYWAFNVADSCIVCGAILFGLSILFSRPKEA